jgi:hypothetical protein
MRNSEKIMRGSTTGRFPWPEAPQQEEVNGVDRTTNGVDA